MDNDAMTCFDNLAISVPPAQDDASAFFDAIQGSFSKVEIDGDDLESAELPRILKRQNLEVVSVVNLIRASLLANLYSQGEKISRELLEVINIRLLKKYNFDIKGFLLDPGLDLSNETKVKSALWLLKSISNAAFRKDRTIYVPMTLPSGNLKKLADNVKSLIYGTMLNNFKVCMKIYVHEVKKDVSPKEIFSAFKFDLGLVRLVYEPSAGNYLTENLIKHWLDPLREIKYNGNIALCPNASNIAVFEGELKRLDALRRSG